MVIPYYQVNAFILNSYKPTYSSLINVEPMISFENYVKSQLHTNVVTGLYKRDIFMYYKTLRFIEGNDNSDEYYTAYKEVLKMYYTDIGNAMLKCIGELKTDFSIIDTNVPKSELLEHESIDVKQVFSDLTEILLNDRMVYSKINYLEILRDIPLKDLAELKPSRLLAEAIIYKHYGKQSKAYRLEVRN